MSWATRWIIVPDAHMDLAWPAYAGEIGWRVSTVRRLRGVSQTELANVAGLSRNAVQNLEQSRSFKNDEAGNATLRSLFRIAQALGVPPALFIPVGVPQSDYRSVDRERLRAELAAEVAKRPLPPTTRTSNRVR
jgi:transcriptional regulator with XRE-family HTH domain